MSALGAWLAAREPAPPAPLADALAEVVDAAADGARIDPAPVGAWDTDRATVADTLAALGRDRLDLALARLGRERPSAYRLLEADALFTYACEAALEAGDASRSLRRILTVAGR